MKKALAIIGLLSLAPQIEASSAIAAADQDKAMRFGISLALLAEEQCAGLGPGPKFHQLMKFVRIGAKSAGKILDEHELYDRSKKEAAVALAGVGKGVCTAAAQVAAPDGIIAWR
jgi:hypothetical protein